MVEKNQQVNNSRDIKIAWNSNFGVPKWSFIGTHTHSFIYILCKTVLYSMTEIVKTQSLKPFPSGTLNKQFADLRSQWRARRKFSRLALFCFFSSFLFFTKEIQGLCSITEINSPNDQGAVTTVKKLEKPKCWQSASTRGSGSCVSHRGQLIIRQHELFKLPLSWLRKPAWCATTFHQ